MNRRIVLIVGAVVGLCIFLCCTVFALFVWYSSRPEFIAELTSDSATFSANRMTSEAPEEIQTAQGDTPTIPINTPKASVSLSIPTKVSDTATASAPTITSTRTPLPSSTSTIGPTGTPSATATPAETNTLSPTYTPSPTIDPVELLEEAIEKILGSSNRDVERLSFVELTDDELFIQWAINDNLFESWIRAGAEDDIKDILRALSDSNIGYSATTLIGTFALIDGFGNESEQMVLSSSYFRDTVNRINWDNYYSIKIFDIADETYFHQAFPDK